MKKSNSGKNNGILKNVGHITGSKISKGKGSFFHYFGYLYCNLWNKHLFYSCKLLTLKYAYVWMCCIFLVIYTNLLMKKLQGVYVCLTLWAFILLLAFTAWCFLCSHFITCLIVSYSMPVIHWLLFFISVKCMPVLVNPKHCFVCLRMKLLWA